jgi:hypothetical protein
MAQQKMQAEIVIEALNRELEPIYRAEREMNTFMRRLHLRGMGGCKPTWSGMRRMVNVSLRLEKLE